MAEIKPSEISELIKYELDKLNQHAKFEEVGFVLQVSDGIARVYGLNNVKSNELVEFDSGIKGIVLNLEEDNVGAVLLGDTEKVKEIIGKLKEIAGTIMTGIIGIPIAIGLFHPSLLYIEAAKGGVIFSLNPVFSALFAYFLLEFVPLLFRLKLSCSTISVYYYIRL